MGPAGAPNSIPSPAQRRICSAVIRRWVPEPRALSHALVPPICPVTIYTAAPNPYRRRIGSAYSATSAYPSSNVSSTGFAGSGLPSRHHASQSQARIPT